jgi:hypothetical protein
VSPEQWVQGIGIGFAVVLAMAGAFWWGWDVRERLAMKLEYFRITNRAWVAYDEKLRAQRGKVVPMPADLHEIRSEK